MIAHVLFNAKGVMHTYNGPGVYYLAIEENDHWEGIACHFSSSRGFACEDLVRHKKEIEENNVTEIYSNGRLVWKSKEASV